MRHQCGYQSYTDNDSFHPDRKRKSMLHWIDGLYPGQYARFTGRNVFFLLGYHFGNEGRMPAAFTQGMRSLATPIGGTYIKIWAAVQDNRAIFDRWFLEHTTYKRWFSYRSRHNRQYYGRQVVNAT